MEDVHHTVDDITGLYSLNSPYRPHAWFAVFDGHAGVESAQNAKDHLLENIVRHPAYAEGNVEEAAKEGFIKTDKEFLAVCSEERAKDPGAFGFRSGCTAICSLLVGNRLSVLNLGDSRAVVCQGGQAIQLSIDHKPSREDEILRIQQAGGHVLFNRVNGVLGVSRALGDFEFKETSADNNNYVISNIPEVTHHTLDTSSQFLILACDGVWDVVSNEEAVQTVMDNLPKNTNSPQKAQIEAAATALTNLALDKNSTDNISVLVVYFLTKHFGEMTKNPAAVPNSPPPTSANTTTQPNNNDNGNSTASSPNENTKDSTKGPEEPVAEVNGNAGLGNKESTAETQQQQAPTTAVQNTSNNSTVPGGTLETSTGNGSSLEIVSTSTNSNVATPTQQLT